VTTDFIVDCLTDWWHNNQSDYTELEELVINLDGGPAIRSDRTQFIKRIVECISDNMTWKGIKPIVHLIETTYEKGVKVLPHELKQYLPEWQRSETLPKWEITIIPF